MGSNKLFIFLNNSITICNKNSNNNNLCKKLKSIKIKCILQIQGKVAYKEMWVEVICIICKVNRKVQI